jgi:hypothetical protein
MVKKNADVRFGHREVIPDCAIEETIAVLSSDRRERFDKNWQINHTLVKRR